MQLDSTETLMPSILLSKKDEGEVEAAVPTSPMKRQKAKRVSVELRAAVLKRRASAGELEATRRDQARLAKERRAASPSTPKRLTRAQRHFQRALKKITGLRRQERERTNAAKMPFEAESAGSRFKKVLRAALKSFPTKNPDRLREAMQNDSSSDEGTDDEDAFSDAGEEMALLASGTSKSLTTVYREACAVNGVLPSSRALVSLRSNNCDVRSVFMGDRAISALAGAMASAGAGMTKINLAQNGLGAVGFRTLAAGIRAGGGASLIECDLSSNTPGDAAVTELVAALGGGCPRMQRLSLSACGMCDAAAAALGDGFRHHAYLEILDVSGGKLGDDGCLALTPLLRGAGSAEPAGRGRRDGGLVSLHANWNRMGPAGAAAVALAGIAAPTALLLTLDVSYNAISDAAGAQIARALATNHTLRLLDASRNRLGPASARAWARAIALTRTLTTLKLGWNRMGTRGSLDIIAAIGAAPPQGRNIAPAALHTLRIENCCGAGDEHELLEAVHTVVAKLSRLNRAAPGIVVEFPDRHRTVLRDCEYAEDEMTHLSRDLWDDDGSIKTTPSMEDLSQMTGGASTRAVERRDDDESADDDSRARGGGGGERDDDDTKTISTHASWLSKESARRKRRRKPFARMLEIPSDAVSSTKFAPPAPQNEHGRGSMRGSMRGSQYAPGYLKDRKSVV